MKIYQLGERVEKLMEKNCPTDPEKWSASKSAAKSKFDVYPSAYANGWAAKNKPFLEALNSGQVKNFATAGDVTYGPQTNGLCATP